MQIIFRSVLIVFSALEVTAPYLVVWLLGTEQSKDARLGRVEVRGHTDCTRRIVGLTACHLVYV